VVTQPIAKTPLPEKPIIRFDRSVTQR